MPRDISHHTFDSPDALSPQESIRHTRSSCDALRLGRASGQANDQAALTPEAQRQAELCRLAAQVLGKQPMTEVQDNIRRQRQKIVTERQNMAGPYFLRTGRYLSDAFGAGNDQNVIIDNINIGTVFDRIATAKQTHNVNTSEGLAAIPQYKGVDKFHKHLLIISKYHNSRFTNYKQGEIAENAYKAYKKLEKAYHGKEFGLLVAKWCKDIRCAFALEHTSGPGESSGVERTKDAPPEEEHKKLVAINAHWMFTALNNRQFHYRATNRAELETNSEGQFEGAQHCWDKMTLISDYQYYSQRGNFSSFGDAMEAYHEIETKCKNEDYGDRMIKYCKDAGFSV